jgi:hypothetical protein
MQLALMALNIYFNDVKTLAMLRSCYLLGCG